MNNIKWFSPNQGILTVTIASYGITLNQAAAQYLKGGEKVRLGISEDKEKLFIQVVDSTEENAYSIPEGIQDSKPIRITCKEFVRYLQIEADINVRNSSKFYASFDSSSKLFTAELNKQVNKDKKEEVEKKSIVDNEFFHNLFNPVYISSSRSFIPITVEDSVTKLAENTVKPPIRYGEVEFDIDTEGMKDFKLKLNMVLVNDTSEKLLGYLLTGGKMENMTEYEKMAIYDEDFGLLIAVDQNNEVEIMCFVEVYTRLGEDVVIPLSHFKKSQGRNEYIISEMIRKKLPFLVEDIAGNDRTKIDE